MEVALASRGRRDAGSLKQVVYDACAGDARATAAGEADLDELPEARRVVVAQCARVAESLEQRVGLQHTLAQYGGTRIEIH